MQIFSCWFQCSHLKGVSLIAHHGFCLLRYCCIAWLDLRRVSCHWRMTVLCLWLTSLSMIPVAGRTFLLDLLDAFLLDLLDANADVNCWFLCRFVGCYCWMLMLDIDVNLLDANAGY